MHRATLCRLQIQPLLFSLGDSLPSRRTGCPWWLPGRPWSKPPTGTESSSSSGHRCRQCCWLCSESGGTRNKWLLSSCHTPAPQLQWQQGKCRKWHKLCWSSEVHTQINSDSIWWQVFTENNLTSFWNTFSICFQSFKRSVIFNKISFFWFKDTQNKNKTPPIS